MFGKAEPKPKLSILLLVWELMAAVPSSYLNVFLQVSPEQFRCPDLRIATDSPLLWLWRQGRRPVTHVSDIGQTDVIYMSDMCQIHVRHWSYTCQTCVRFMSDIGHIHVRWMSDIGQTHVIYMSTCVRSRSDMYLDLSLSTFMCI